MRNLKKFLALVLAVMMAMSLMATANAAVRSNAEYGDDYQVNEAFEEAVTVLSGMGVIKGYSDGATFQPKNLITRAEAAALIYRLHTGDVGDDSAQLYAVYGNFPDVTLDKWYAGYVGYCANHGIIKGRPDGTFDPTANVTGYEILAMILRAVGYDKNGEFSGSNWAYNVATLSTSLGVKNKVNSANYTEATFYQPASREVVASLLFETTANVPQVIYSDSLRYMDTGMTGGILSGDKNPTLGQQHFGLTSNWGVVVGNQATGEKETKIGFSLMQSVGGRTPEIDDTLGIGNNVASSNGSAYVYATDKTNANNVTLTFKFDTDLELFGHRVKVWYDNRSGQYETAGTQKYRYPTNLDTFAVLDKAVSAKVVSATGDLDLAKASPVNTDLVKKGSFDGNVYWNYSFGPTKNVDYQDNPGDSSSWSADNDFKSPIQKNNSTDDHPLYLLISNTPSGTVDLVISLDMTISQIAQENSVKAPYNVGVYNLNGNTSNQYFDKEDTENAASTQNYANIDQDSLVCDSPTKLGAKVAAIEITGTTNTNSGSNANNAGGNAADPSSGADEIDSTYYYQLTELKNVVPVTVVNINYNTQEVYLSDGSSLKKSVFAEAVDGRFKDTQYINAPRVFTTYNFTLDREGNYIYWEPITADTNFVYGTYLDYQTEFTSSKYTYKMVGVDSKGQQTIPEVTGYSLTSSPFANISFSTTDMYRDNPLPKRDASGASGDYSVGTVRPGQYVGYTISGGKLQAVTGRAGGWGGIDQQPMVQGSAIDFASQDTTIEPKDATIGAVKVGNSSLFLTNDTQFYVVSGAGTESQKVEPYKGLAELLDGNRSVVIKGAQDIASNTVFDDDVDGDSTKNKYAEMIYFADKPFDYAQTYVGSATAATVVFIPKAAIQFNKATTGNLYFVGDSSSTVVNAIGETATLFTVYKDGVETSRWIAGDNRVAGNNAYTVTDNGDNVFYNLVDSGKKTSNNEPIYTIAAVADTSSGKSAAGDSIVIGKFWADTTGDGAGNALATTTNPGSGNTAKYSATTYSTQAAFINATGHTGNLYNVGGAVVANADTDKYPGVKDLATLHQAGSLYDNEGIEVSCVLGENAQTVSYIYVNVQTVSP